MILVHTNLPHLCVWQLIDQGKLATTYEQGSAVVPELPAGEDIYCTFNGCILQEYKYNCWAYLEDEARCSFGKYAVLHSNYLVMVQHADYLLLLFGKCIVDQNILSSEDKVTIYDHKYPTGCGRCLQVVSTRIPVLHILCILGYFQLCFTTKL